MKTAKYNHTQYKGPDYARNNNAGSKNTMIRVANHACDELNRENKLPLSLLAPDTVTVIVIVIVSRDRLG